MLSSKALQCAFAAAIGLTNDECGDLVNARQHHRQHFAHVTARVTRASM